jgi:hypothetical protein
VSATSTIKINGWNVKNVEGSSEVPNNSNLAPCQKYTGQSPPLSQK